ncbi:MAG TPA: Flp family type IVb pilin [Candidatus Cybelea sp.]|jgi:pilus assembly protein Flp/PilA|nr:Flp family type IVb pilin [Candidatus Cybelea sp.]
MRTAVTLMMRDEEGASMVEYALLVAVIAMVALVAIQTFGINLEALFNTMAGSV